ncbi:MAG: DMT family transporter [Ignavibacteria bacterium]
MKETPVENHRLQSWIILIILSLVWGSSFILIKKGLESFSPDQVGTIRISFAFLFMLPFALKSFKIIPKEKWKFVAFTGLIGNLIPALLFAVAQTKIESSLSGILNGLSPLFTLILAIVIFKYKLKFWQTLGLLIGFLGTLGLSFVNSSGGLGNMNIYILLIVLATMCYAISLNFVKVYLDNISSVVITSLAMFTIGPVSLIYLFTTDFFEKLNSTPGAFESLGYIAILGIVGTAIALILYTRFIQMTNAVIASSVTYLIPIVAILWGLLDGEKLYPLHFAGMFMILMGIYFVNKTKLSS